MPVIKCRKCQEVCRGDVLRVSNEYFHYACFCCEACGCDLVPAGYYENDGRFYCKADFKKMICRICDLCGAYINGDMVSVLDKFFHHDCFYCHTCRQNFKPGMRVTYWNSQFFCTNCFKPEKRAEEEASRKDGDCKSDLTVSGVANQVRDNKANEQLKTAGNASDYETTKGVASNLSNQAEEDLCSSFCKELAERLAVQYTACEKHVSDGTNLSAADSSNEHHEPDKKSEETHPSGDADKKVSTESPQTEENPPAHDEPAKTEVPTTSEPVGEPENQPNYAEQSTKSPVRLPPLSNSTSSSSLSRVPAPGRVATLVKLLEEMPKYGALDSTNLYPQRSPTDRNQDSLQNQFAPPNQYDKWDSYSRAPNSDKSTTLYLPTDRAREQKFSTQYSTHKTPEAVHICGPHPIGNSSPRKVNFDGKASVINRKRSTSPPPPPPLPTSHLSRSVASSTPVRRSWLPVRNGALIPVTTIGTYRPTPFIEAGYKLSCSVSAQAGSPKIDSTVENSTQETSRTENERAFQDAPLKVEQLGQISGAQLIEMTAQDQLSVMQQYLRREEFEPSSDEALHSAKQESPQTDVRDTVASEEEKRPQSFHSHSATVRRRPGKRLKFRHTRCKSFYGRRLTGVESAVQTTQTKHGRRKLKTKQRTKNTVSRWSLLNLSHGPGSFGQMILGLSVAAISLVFLLASLAWFAERQKTYDPVDDEKSDWKPNWTKGPGGKLYPAPLLQL
ncbi:unnamed protein product [Calicophoron daubneyi]|uniref:LIM zinc-binding domain-containing protein n=1 Tax=Calicophoron daubneyi TaxID=300641 RepID=A0AAV2TI97_CALDB